MRSVESARALCREHPLTAYCLLAFAITWGLKYAYALVKADYGMPAFNFSLIAQFGPSLSAVFLIALTEGREGLRRTGQSLLNWRVGPGWILLAAGFEPVLFLSITLLYWVNYGAFPATSAFSILAGVGSLVVTFLIGVVRWGLAEEIGWRGWMFPKLQHRMSPFKASIILAIVTTLWHVHPYDLSEVATSKDGAYLTGSFPEVVERLIISIPIVLVITFIYNNTKGSLLLMMIFHSASNTSYFWVEETFGIVRTEFFRTSFLSALLILTVVFSIVVIRQKNKAHSSESP
jgi:membrane protease YdiL (CAAX protease family)